MGNKLAGGFGDLLRGGCFLLFEPLRLVFVARHGTRGFNPRRVFLPLVELPLVEEKEEERILKKKGKGGMGEGGGRSGDLGGRGVRNRSEEGKEGKRRRTF